VGNVWVLAEAVAYAVDPDGNPATADGADVINLSLSTVRETKLISNLLAKVCGGSDALDLPVSSNPYLVVVAAAGNGGDSTRQYPAAENVDGLIAVGATTVDDVLASFSSRGSWIQVAAPGAKILSTVPGGKYGTWSGTSMAAPIVAAEAALVRATFPDLLNKDIARHVERMSVEIGGDVPYRIDAGIALTSLPESGSTPSPTPTPTPTPTPNFTLSANPTSLTVNRGGTGTSSITITRTGGFTSGVTFGASGLPSGVSASFNPPSTTGTSTVVTLSATATATLGSATITISGTGNGLTRSTQISLSVNPGGGTGGVTVTPVINSSGPWFNDQAILLSNTGNLTAVSITIVVQRTTGISHQNQYNTVGTQILQSNNSTTSTITYTFSLATGQTLGVGTNRMFAAQTSGTGTVHSFSGDTYTVTYTTGGTTFTQTGHF
jgi:Subtilase family